MTLPATDPNNHAHKFVRRYFDLQPVLVPICAIGLAFAIGSIVILAVGENPIEAYTELLKGMFGSPERISASLGRSTPYIGAALSVAFAFRAGLFNIGVEGQLLVGATVAAWVGTWSMLSDFPGIVIIPIILLAGVVGGGFYGAIPGVLKARTGAHEVIVTIMLNSIAVFYVRWLVGSQDPVILRDVIASRPQTAPLPASARLPELPDLSNIPVIGNVLPAPNSGQPLHFGFFLMLGLCFVVWFLLQRTTMGFEVRMLGANAPAARYAAFASNRVIVLVMVSAGAALAGIAGASEVAGTTGFLLPGVFLAVGFDSIAIALLARANPFAIVPAAILWGSMLAGAPLMQQETGLSIDLVRIIQALVLLFVAADVIVRTIFQIRKRDMEIGPMAEVPVSAALGGPA